MSEPAGPPPGSAARKVAHGGGVTHGPLGVYLHIPFCLSKCGYCDFYSVPCGKGGEEARVRELIPAYVEALKLEASAVVTAAGVQSAPVETVFFGGGTPSLLSAGQVSEVLDHLRGLLQVSDGAEVTLEVNPETAAPCAFEGYLKAGVTRFSIGIQSMDPGELKILGRIHGLSQAKAAVGQARLAGAPSVGVDLIYGVPGQNVEGWRRTLSEAIALGPDHISAYCLTLEEGTPLASKLRKSHESLAAFEESQADLQADMYLALMETAAAAGLMRYEVSNFARPGHECRHNLGYWRQGSYLGLGPGAHSHLDGTRWSNRSDIDAYLDSGDPGDPGEALLRIQEGHETLSLRQRMSEMVFLALRTSAGLGLREFEERFDIAFEQAFAEPFAQLRADNALTVDSERVRVSVDRLSLLDLVAREFV